MKGDGVGCVGRVGLPRCGVDHEFAVAVVGGDEAATACAAERLRYPVEACVNVLDGLDGLLKIAGVADHVGVREVDDEDIGLALFNATQDFVCDFEGGHLRHQIVGRDLRRRHEQTALGRKFFFGAAVEEVRDVRVLLRLCESVVSAADGGGDFGEKVFGSCVAAGDGQGE